MNQIKKTTWQDRIRAKIYSLILETHRGWPKAVEIIANEIAQDARKQQEEEPWLDRCNQPTKTERTVEVSFPVGGHKYGTFVRYGLGSLDQIRLPDPVGVVGLRRSQWRFLLCKKHGLNRCCDE